VIPVRAARAIAAAAAGLLLATGITGPASSAPASPAVLTATLENGLRAVVVRDELAPVVSVTTTYLAGSAQETVSGTAHAQEHMMFRGSATVSEAQFAEAIAAMGGSFNAVTQSEATQYSVEVPARDLDVALRLERSRASGIRDDAKAWSIERSAVLQEVQADASSANFRLLERAGRVVFAGTPYENYGLGTVDSVRRLRTADLKTFYDRWYRPNDMLIVVAGDVDPPAALAEIRAVFGDLRPGKLPARRAGSSAPIEPQTFRDSGNDPFGLVFAAYRTPGYRDRDYFAMKVLDAALESERGPLYELKVQGRALQVFAQSVVHPEIGMTLLGCVMPVTRDPQDALRDVDAALAEYRAHGIPDDVVSAAKRRAVLAVRLARTSVARESAQWASALALESRTPQDDAAGLAAVTSDQVNAAFRRYIGTERVVAIATQAPSGGSIASRRPPESLGTSPSGEPALPSFAKRLQHEIVVPEPHQGTSLATLPNGLKVAVVPRPGAGTVTVRGVVLATPALATPDGKEGVDRILDGMFTSGTAKTDRVTFEAEADSIGAYLGAGSTFSLDVAGEDFARGMRLLAEKQLDPDLSAATFEKVKAQLAAAVRGEAAGTRGRAQRALNSAIYPPGDPARRVASPESVERITADDVRSYYHRVFQPRNTTIVVIGDVDRDSAVATVAAAFGSWQSDEQPIEIFPPAVPDNASSAVELSAPGARQADVTLAESVALTYDDPDYAALQVLNAALTGGFYSSLLSRDLRERSGIAYRVDSSFNGGKHRSRFVVSFGCSPDRVGEGIAIVKRDLESLRTASLTRERLDRIKAQMTARLALEDESFDGIADSLLTYVATGRPIDESYRLARREIALTPDDLSAAARRWIRPDDLASIVVVPGG
jgi:zinc protease